MTAVEMFGSVDELTDAAVRSIDAATLAEFGPYRKSRMNWPDAGEIAFGAIGFTQTLRAEPVLTDKQCLSRHERRRPAT